MADPRGSGWADAGVLVGLQWAAAGTLAVAAVVGAGTFSVALPALAVFAGAAAWPKARAAAFDRPGIRRLSRRVGLLHAVVGPLLVVALAAGRPEWMEGAHPVASALAAGPFAGMAGFVLTLCGLSATADDWGPLNGATPP